MALLFASLQSISKSDLSLSLIRKNALEVKESLELKVKAKIELSYSFRKSTHQV